MIKKHILLAGLASLIVLPGIAQTLTAHQEIEKRVISVDETGEETVAFVPAAMVAPGDTVRYVLQYDNQGGEPAEAVTLTMPVPEQTDLVEVSTPLETTIVSYSYDGGDTFGPEADMADDLDPTHLRWTFTEDVPAGAEGQVSFIAILN